ncbi:hypothetical protein WJX74_001448 [Apatococcus lobatus]|uniref:Phosphodiesterase n=1 Tax=Apatococcus lobatus TaxID=904363 RepID=A0AAW1RU04_9CHLO
MSGQSANLGQPAGDDWHLTDLRTLELVQTPCYITRPKPEVASLKPLWANKAAIEKYGPLTTPEERDKLIGGMSKASVAAMKAMMAAEYESVAMGNEMHTWHFEARIGLSLVFSEVPAGQFIDLHVSSCTYIIDGKIEKAILCQCMNTTTPVLPTGLQPTSAHQQGKIHSYLFSSSAWLLHANEAAINDWKSRGVTLSFNDKSFGLADLLQEKGIPQPEAAMEAINAIFVHKRDVHRTTLAATNSEGTKTKWITYEIWPALDPMTSQPAMLINTLDMTEQKSLEIELEHAKRELLRRNQSLETRKTKLEADQAGLKRQQQALADQLKQALELHLHPRTAVDTMTVADKAINVLEKIIQGHQPSLQEAVDVRNAMVEAHDLRQPQNLDKQLMQESGISKDVGLAMVELLQGGSHTSAQRIMARQVPTKAFPVIGSDLLQSRQRDPFWMPPTTASSSMQALDGHIGMSLIPEAEQLLQEASSSWEFDMFRLADQTDRPLSTLGFFLIKNAGLLDLFGLSEEVLSRWLRSIEQGYPWNSYHNRVHAASVLQMMHMLIHAGLMEDGVLEGITMFACYLAAIAHDFDHPGVNNDFLIKTRHPLAVTHNDASPLENHHISAAYMLAHADEALNFAAPMSSQDESILRASCIELVLSTDMKKHFSLVSCFQAIQQPSVSFESTSAAALTVPPGAQSPGPDRRLGNLATQQKLLIAQVALKCSDLSHLACTPEVHGRWVEKLTEEFFLQGDQEQARGLPISPLMDRSKTQGMSKSQVGFLEIVALPLFTAYQELMPGSRPMLDNVRANYKQWHQLNAV